MLNYLWMLCSVPFIVFSFLRMKRELHMLQLNSYMNERYGRWLKEKNRPDYRELLPIAAAGPLFIGGNVGFFVALLLWVLAYSMMLRGHEKKPAKKPLDLTKRARRLFLTALLLYFVPALLLVLVIMSNQAVPLYLKGITICILTAMPFAASLFMLAANSLLHPFEERMKAKYFREAQERIRENPGLLRIAITGSYGKTSVKHILNQILEEKYYTLMPPGSYNTPMGITRVIREELKPVHQAFVTEMGAKLPGDIAELCRLVQPQYGILTAIGPQHLETFKTVETIVATKSELLDALPEDGVAVLNFDDENIRANAGRVKGKVISYGLHGADLDYRATEISYHNRGSRFQVVAADGETVEFKTKLLGEHNIYNIVAAVAMARQLGIGMEKAKGAVAMLPPVDHRLELKTTQNGLIIIDDAFNSNPVGAKKAMEVLALMEGGRKFLITPGLVELGDKEAEENRAFGMEAAKACDYAALVGIKQTQPIREGLLAAGFPEDRVFMAQDLTAANTYVYGRAKAGDIILYENDLPDTYNE